MRKSRGKRVQPSGVGWRLAVASVVVSIGLGACSNGPPPRVWAASVCTALTPWRTEISSLTKRAQQQQDEAPNTAQAKENLTRLFAGAQDATEAARKKVQAAGTPDVDGGDAIAGSFIAALAGVRDAYSHARDGISAITDTEPKAFSDDVATVLIKLNDEYSKTAPNLTSLNSVELQKAFDEVPECR